MTRKEAPPVPEWVKVGAKIAEYYGWHGEYTGRIYTIAKVYKTGRFLVEGSPKQWRVWWDRVEETSGLTKGHHMTPEVEAEIAAQNLERKARNLLFRESERLSKLSRRGEGAREDVIQEALSLGLLEADE